jgi:pimeloyl-ACP methyl ester carboxylesterase
MVVVDGQDDFAWATVGFSCFLRFDDGVELVGACHFYPQRTLLPQIDECLQSGSVGIDYQIGRSLAALCSRFSKPRLLATLSWPGNLPIEGEPAEVASVVNDYSGWLAEADVPKLFINAEPGAVVHGRSRELIRTWPNLTETTVSGVHFVREDSPEEIGTAVAEFVRTNGAT